MRILQGDHVALLCVENNIKAKGKTPLPTPYTYIYRQTVNTSDIVSLLREVVFYPPFLVHDTFKLYFRRTRFPEVDRVVLSRVCRANFTLIASRYRLRCHAKQTFSIPWRPHRRLHPNFYSWRGMLRK